MTAAAVTPRPAGHNVAHVAAAASILTAAFMLMTASELGPFGPLVIAEAFYVAAFAVTFEVLLLAIQGWSFIRSVIRKRAVQTASATAEGAVQ